MNILYIIGVYPGYGGTEKVTTVIANEFVRRGHNVQIASFEQRNMELLAELKPEVTFHTLTKPVYTKSNLQAIRKILIEGQIDIIDNQWCLPYKTTHLINRARRGLSCRLVSALHGVPDKSKRVIVAEDEEKAARNFVSRTWAKIKVAAFHAIIRRSILLTYHYSDAYVVLSNGFVETLKQYTGLRQSDKLYAIGSPVSITTDYTQTYAAKKQRQILYVGRLDKENKRVNRIVEAWEAIAADYPDWSLVLVGDGPHREELQQYVADRHVARVTFTGFIQEEPVAYYKDAALFMLTSDLEGFGLVLVEAMCYGVVPIVYGSYVTVHDIVDDGKTGIITPMPYDQQTTIQAMRRLMDDDALRQRMSLAAQESSRRFELTAVVDKWERLFNQLIQSNLRSHRGG
jgi:glycosyltransferase involved in cell wall biosynthesis